MLTAERLREVLRYDPETGNFVWLKSLSTRKPAGCVAGTKSKDGSILISVDNVTYRAARLVWFYMRGEWPAKYVDHKDGDPTNNRWDNLREATPAQNQWNKGNTSGYKGVFLYTARPANARGRRELRSPASTTSSVTSPRQRKRTPLMWPPPSACMANLRGWRDA